MKTLKNLPASAASIATTALALGILAPTINAQTNVIGFFTSNSLPGGNLAFEPQIPDERIAFVTTGQVIFQQTVGLNPVGLNPSASVGPGNQFRGQDSLWVSIPQGQSPSAATNLTVNLSGFREFDIPSSAGNVTAFADTSVFFPVDVIVPVATNLVSIQMVTRYEGSLATNDNAFNFADIFHNSRLLVGGTPLQGTSGGASIDLLSGNPTFNNGFTVEVTTNVVVGGVASFSYVLERTDVVHISVGEAYTGLVAFVADMYVSTGFGTDATTNLTTSVDFDYPGTMSMELSMLSPGLSFAVIPEPAIIGLLGLIGLYIVLGRRKVE